MSIWTDIISTLETAANGMTTGGGYNYDYDNINEWRPGSKTYPSMEITFPNAAESVHDEIADGVWFDTEVDFTVTVDATTANPDEAMDDVEQDLIRLMETNHDSLQGSGMVEANFVSADREYTMVRARPGKVTIKFRLSWRVKRSDPALTI